MCFTAVSLCAIVLVLSVFLYASTPTYTHPHLHPHSHLHSHSHSHTHTQRARVTLENCYPTGDKSALSDERLSAYRDKIIKVTERIGAKFLDYDTRTGRWTFEVEHFSTYRLPDDMDMDMHVHMDQFEDEEDETQGLDANAMQAAAQRFFFQAHCSGTDRPTQAQWAC